MRKSYWLLASTLLALGMGFGHAGCYTSGTPGGFGAGGSSSEGGAANTDAGDEDDAGDAGSSKDVETCGSNSAACAENVDGNGKALCEPTTNLCVQCIVSADCPTIAGSGSQPASDQYCYKNACAKYKACETALDCVGFADAAYCDSNLHCVQCNIDADCTTAGLSETKCLANVCRLPCVSDGNCTPNGLLCNLDAGACTELCHTPSDCRPGYACSANRCVPN